MRVRRIRTTTKRRPNRFNLQQYKADRNPGGTNVYWDTRHRLDTNATDGQSINDYDESGSADNAIGGTKDTGVMTATYDTTVGAHLAITGRVSTVASAYGTGASARRLLQHLQGRHRARRRLRGAGPRLRRGRRGGAGEPGSDLHRLRAHRRRGHRVAAGSVACTDADGDPLAYTVVDGPAHGTLSDIAADGGFTYTPAAGFNGSDSFTFKANDGQADSGVATVSITVSPVNDLPVCTAGTGTTDAGVAMAASLSCTDPDDDPLTFGVVTGPASGMLSAIAADGSFTYTPNAGFSGTDSFTFKASDGTGTSADATFGVTVNRVPVDAAHEQGPVQERRVEDLRQPHLQEPGRLRELGERPLNRPHQRR